MSKESEGNDLAFSQRDLERLAEYEIFVRDNPSRMGDAVNPNTPPVGDLLTKLLPFGVNKEGQYNIPAEVRTAIDRIKLEIDKKADLSVQVEKWVRDNFEDLMSVYISSRAKPGGAKIRYITDPTIEKMLQEALARPDIQALFQKVIKERQQEDALRATMQEQIKAVPEMVDLVQRRGTPEQVALLRKTLEDALKKLT